MIDACNQEPKPLLSIAEALNKIIAATPALTDLEEVTLPNALGRILLEPLASPINIPCHRNSAMDGYAFNSIDAHDGQDFTLTEVGTSWAGHPYQGTIAAGQCIRIFTGAVVPEQADSVIMQEQVKTTGQNVHFPANPALKQNIRAAGEDVKQGACLIRPPKKLNAADLGLLASAGIEKVSVTRKLKIACFSTGDELTVLGQDLDPGKIYDSNRYCLAALLADPCFQVTDFGIIADDREQLSQYFLDAARNHDVIISTGGASVGTADFITDILSSIGHINFWKIAIKPGKPFAFGSIGNCHFFGLPGNPIAIFITFQQLVQPALTQLCGSNQSKPLRLKATLNNPIRKTPGREEFQRGILSQDQNYDFFVSCPPKQGSHIMSSMSQANCYIVLPKGCAGLESGDTVIVEPFSAYL